MSVPYSTFWGIRDPLPPWFTPVDTWLIGVSWYENTRTVEELAARLACFSASCRCSWVSCLSAWVSSMSRPSISEKNSLSACWRAPASTAVPTNNNIHTINYFTPGSGGREILWSVCLYVCLFVCPLAYLKNHKRVPPGRGSVNLWRQCDTLYIFIFIHHKR